MVGAGASAAGAASAGDFFALDRGVALPAGSIAPASTDFGPPTGKVIAQLLVQTS